MARQIDPSLHALLRQSTTEVHERLHRHDGFAAIQSRTIGIAAYRNLLIRLYGFYVPFEGEALIGKDRSTWLEEDLCALGLELVTIRSLPKCACVPDLDNAEKRLGALYVVEGSALGGRHLARALGPLLGDDITAGRRFFLGRGAGTGDAWKGYLTKLSAASSGIEARIEITEAAMETFAAFEDWLSGWRFATHD